MIKNNGKVLPNEHLRQLTEFLEEAPMKMNALSFNLSIL
ncbi:unnamed protein product [Acidithrix sp. C25]|nr:unnamed protein product [Acidithrix sp. C25]